MLVVTKEMFIEWFTILDYEAYKSEEKKNLLRYDQRSCAYDEPVFQQPDWIQYPELNIYTYTHK
jgi:hypothetical protein